MAKHKKNIRNGGNSNTGRESFTQMKRLLPIPEPQTVKVPLQRKEKKVSMPIKPNKPIKPSKPLYTDILKKVVHVEKPQEVMTRKTRVQRHVVSEVSFDRFKPSYEAWRFAYYGDLLEMYRIYSGESMYSEDDIGDSDDVIGDNVIEDGNGYTTEDSIDSIASNFNEQQFEQFCLFVHGCSSGEICEYI